MAPGEACYAAEAVRFAILTRLKASAGQLGPEFVLASADVPQLPPSAHCLPPAEDLLHPLAEALADDVAEMSDGSTVDGAAAMRVDVLGDVRGHARSRHPFTKSFVS
jgi:hypothetical protein